MTLNSTRFFLLFTLIFSSYSWAQTRYVTDLFEITLRSGTSTSNNILSMLKSGQAVTILEEDVATKYSLVETENGKQGYVLSRFLDTEPSGRERFAQLQEISNQQESTMGELRKELDNYKNTRKNDNGTITELQANLNRTSNELEKLKEDTRDTIRVIKQNDKLKARINDLESEKLLLSEENAKYKDSTAMDWFVRGASVSLIAFLIGILITRIRWKKRDSWGRY